jgi:hypothetical protein
MAKTQVALPGLIEPSSEFLLPDVYLDGLQLRHDVLQCVATCRDPTARGFGPFGIWAEAEQKLL